jgi:hypothetical protein
VTIFGPPWGDLELASVATYLAGAEDDPLLWEAKATADDHAARKEVGAFGNSHDGS